MDENIHWKKIKQNFKDKPIDTMINYARFIYKNKGVTPYQKIKEFEDMNRYLSILDLSKREEIGEITLGSRHKKGPRILNQKELDLHLKNTKKLQLTNSSPDLYNIQNQSKQTKSNLKILQHDEEDDDIEILKRRPTLVGSGMKKKKKKDYK